MIKTLKARDEYEIRELVSDYIEVGYNLKTAPYKAWWGGSTSRWRAKVEAPKGQLEARLEGQR
jgi:hypothetical protein